MASGPGQPLGGRNGVWLIAGAGIGVAMVLAIAAYLMGLRAGGTGPRLLPSPPRVAEKGQTEPLMRYVMQSPSPRETPSLVPPLPSESEEPALPEDEPEMSPDEHRTKVIEELRASGPAEELATPAAAVFAGWGAKLKDLGVEGTFEPYECYAKGCFTTAHHADGDAASRAAEVIIRTGEFNGWQSGKMRTGEVINGDGKVEVTWILFPPAKDKSALPDELPPDTLDELKAAWAPSGSGG